MKRIAILQSNYIPWRGYFDLMASVDEFILYDDVQYTRRDWRNRNLIKTPHGSQWLTVPVQVKGRYHQTVRETRIDGDSWAERHWRALEQNYRRAPCFNEVSAGLELMYRQKYVYLSELNCALIVHVARALGIRATIRFSSDFELTHGKTERLISICQQAGADQYVTGPAARAYLDADAFAEARIAVDWFSYEGYRDYPQLWGAFDPHVSVVDLLCNVGALSGSYLRFGTMGARIKPGGGS